MEEKKLSRYCRLLGIALIAGGACLFMHPSTTPLSYGYASLDSSVPTLDKLTQFEFEEEEEPQESQGNTEAVVSPETSSENNIMKTQAEDKQKKQKENKEEKKQEKTKTITEENKQEIKTVYEETKPIPQEETVVKTNTQYIGNSGMVFMSYEEATAYAKQFMQEYPDTTQSFEIKESWQYPIDGSRQYTIDFIFTP